MPEFEDLHGNTVKVGPSKLKLLHKEYGYALLRQEAEQTPCHGVIHVECASAQAFAEILQSMLASADHLTVIEDAAKALWNPPSHPEKVELWKRLEAAYFDATGWHLTGTPRASVGRGLPPGVSSPQE